MTDLTLLRLTGMGIPPYSARGITQTLEPIAEALFVQRTINAGLEDWSASQFRKYRSTLSCVDQQVPAVSGMWPGSIVTVDCIQELAHEDTTDAEFERTAVPGSVREENGFVFYRPRLTMMVIDCPTSVDEWRAARGWEIQLEEV